MTYQQNVFFRLITLHNINCLKRKVFGEYFSEITYKKNNILWNQRERWKRFNSRVCLEHSYNEFCLFSDFITNGKVTVHNNCRITFRNRN